MKKRFRDGGKEVENFLEKLANLERQGQRQLNNGEWAGAIKTYREMLRLDEHPSLRNNLAYALYMEDLDDEALRVLEPIAALDLISPFSQALTAIILAKLGKKEQAKSYLEKAIKQFDLGVINPEGLGFNPSAWREYTVIIKRAAGLLGEDRLVIDLHRKWEQFYQSPEDPFQAGVAFFNLGYPQKAVELWSKIAKHWIFVTEYIRVAEALTFGLIPRFSLPYNPPEFKGGTNLAKLRASLAQGDFKAMALSLLFQPDCEAEAALALLQLLIGAGEWGIAFGKLILENERAPLNWKVAAASSLISLGILPEDEPVLMVIDGIEHKVFIKREED